MKRHLLVGRFWVAHLVCERREGRVGSLELHRQEQSIGKQLRGSWRAPCFYQTHTSLPGNKPEGNYTGTFVYPPGILALRSSRIMRERLR